MEGKKKPVIFRKLKLKIPFNKNKRNKKLKFSSMETLENDDARLVFFFPPLCNLDADVLLKWYY